MYKLNGKFEEVQKLFNSNNKKFVFESIIEGNTPGEIYVNSLENPELYVIFDGGNFVLYIGGETATQEEYKKCVSYIRENILTESLKEEFDEWILISYTSDIWKNALLEGLKGLRVEQDKRVLYRYDIENVDNKKLSNLSCEIKPIDEEILKNDNLENIEDLKEEICDMWGNLEGFIESGFGYCALDGEKLISWCTGEFFSKDYCGIGIFTIEEERKKGIGAEVALNFLKESAKRNLIPHWDAWAGNLPSIKVAEKVGLNKIEEYEVLVVQF